MAEVETKAKGLGISPVVLIVAGLGLVATAILLIFPGIFGGGPPGTGVVPTVVDTSPPAIVTHAAPSADEAKPDDPLASFLVRFGRANPFAPLGAVAVAKGPGTRPPVARVRRQWKICAPACRTCRGAQATAGTPAASSGPEGDHTGRPNSQGPPNEGYVLRGIVRYQSKSLAVIVNGTKVYFVGAGDALEKTNYTVREIGDDRVIIASGVKELVLVLGGKKP